MLKSVLSLFLLVLISTSVSYGQKRKKKGTATDGTEYSDKFHELFFTGIKERNLGNYDKAEEAFLECLELVKSEPALYLELSKIYWDRNQIKEAITNASEAFDLAPNNEDIFNHYVGFLESKRLYGGAIIATKTYLKQLERGSDQVKYSKKLAALHAYNETYSEAIKIYDELESDYGFLNDYAFQRYNLYKSLGNIDEAKRELDQLIDKNPDRPLYFYLKANLLNNQNETEEALSYYDKAIEIDPSHMRSLIESADILLNSNPKEAIPRYKKAFALDENNINRKLEAYNRLQNVANKDELLDLAKVIQEQHSENAKANQLLFDAYKSSGKAKEGLIFLEHASILDKNDFSILADLLSTYYDLKLFDKLKSTSDRNIEVFPNQPALYLFSAMASMEQEEYDEAIMILNTGEKIIIGNSGIRLNYKLTLADVYHRQGKYDESDKLFEQLIGQGEEPIVLNNYAFFLAERGDDLPKAKKLGQKALALDPDNATYMDTYGWVLFKQKEFKESVEWLNKAIEIGGNDSEVLEHLGDAYAKAGDIDLAVENWIKARENGGNSNTLEKKIREKRYYEK